MRIVRNVTLVGVFAALGCQLDPGEVGSFSSVETRSAAQRGGGTFCGGIAGIPCPEGQVCKLVGDYPDASGYCVGAKKECDADTDCFHTGCSGQLCASENIFTTCEWTCEYGCYQQAKCGCSAGGQCRFARAPALRDCLQNCKRATLERL